MKVIKHIIFILFACVIGVTTSTAQEYPVYNQYHFHNYLMNPALAGAAECTHFMLTHKQQWVGIKDAPRTSILSFQTRTGIRLGIGGYFYLDKNGYSSQQGGEITLAYHIPLSRENRYSRTQTLDKQLSFGVSGKFYNYQLDADMVREANDQNDNIYQKEGFYPNVNVGVFYQGGPFFTGLSVTNLIPVKIDMFSDEEPIRPITGMLQLGYAFEANNEFLFEPSGVFKIDEEKRSQLDLGFRFIHHLPNQDISWWAGCIYKQALDEYQPLVLLPNVTFRMGKFRVGYAINIDLNKLVSHNYSTHEIMIGYSLCQSKKFCR